MGPRSPPFPASAICCVFASATFIDVRWRCDWPCVNKNCIPHTPAAVQYSTYYFMQLYYCRFSYEQYLISRWSLPGNDYGSFPVPDSPKLL